MDKKTKIFNISIIIASIAIVAGLGTLFVNLGMEWFNSLTKPTQWLANFIIPIVWSIIYVAFAVILSIWITKEKLPKHIFVELILNGIFNILWCLIFFTLNLTFLGNVVIVINVLLGIKLIFDIEKYNKTYSWILSIYPIWLCIASTLNIALWILN